MCSGNKCDVFLIRPSGEGVEPKIAVNIRDLEKELHSIYFCFEIKKFISSLFPLFRTLNRSLLFPFAVLTRFGMS
jgi:hypothetical protein